MKFFNLICVLLVGMLVTACIDEIQSPEYGKGEGSLILSEMKVETVVGDVITRASLDESVLPSVSDFTIEIVNSEGNTVKTLQPGTLQCKLDAGNYTVKAIYGDADAMSYIPAFYGEEIVNIIEGKATNVSIETKFIQTVIRPQISTDLAQQFEECNLTITSSDVEPVALENDKDFFIPSDGTYTLTLSGINKLGENFSHSWEYENLAVCTRYIVECNPDLPAFTLPEQSEGDVWSKFIYITPMTIDNMTAHKEDMAQKVMDNVVYEVSSDGLTWIQSQKTEDGKIVIKDLQPSTTYTIRSRFGAVISSNTQQVVTESAQQLENGDMENWTKNELYGGNGTFSAPVYCDYCTGWNTRNERTTLGAENASGGAGGFLPIGGNYGASWRWHSGTLPTTDVKDGSFAAEISTLAFYNQKLNGAYSRDKIFNLIINDGTSFVGYLFLGTYDKNSDSYSLGIPHESRPVSISFDYKYIPLPEDDNCIVYAIVYDNEYKEIARTAIFNSSQQIDYITQTLCFEYEKFNSKANYIGVFFQSGSNLEIAKMQHVKGDYNVSPYNKDRVVGSVLKIDNVTLNYDL